MRYDRKLSRRLLLATEVTENWSARPTGPAEINEAAEPVEGPAADAAMERTHEVLVEWLMMQPTTTVGVIATLEHAVTFEDERVDHSFLLEGAHYHYTDQQRTASEQLPAIVAAALRRLITHH